MQHESVDLVEVAWQNAFDSLPTALTQVVLNKLLPKSMRTNASIPTKELPKVSMQRWFIERETDQRKADIRSAWALVNEVTPTEKPLVMQLLMMLLIQSCAQEIKTSGQAVCQVPHSWAEKLDLCALPIATAAHAMHGQGLKLLAHGDQWRVENMLPMSRLGAVEAFDPEQKIDSNLQRIRAEIQALLDRVGNAAGLEDLSASIARYEEDHHARPFVVLDQGELTPDKRTHMQTEWRIPVVETSPEAHQSLHALYKKMFRDFAALVLPKNDKTTEATGGEQTVDQEIKGAVGTIINANQVTINRS